MSPNRVAIDALTRALCPSINVKLLCRAASWPLAPVGRTSDIRRLRNNVSTRGCCARQIRAAHTDSPPEQETLAVTPEPPETLPQEQTGSGEPGEPRDLDPIPPHRDVNRARPPNTQSRKSALVTAQDIIDSPSSDYRYDTLQATTPVLYEALRSLRHRPGQGAKIRALVRFLVHQRGERPNVFLYEALVVANWDTTDGTAGELTAIFKELKTAKIEPSQGWYHSALRLLAIHPDYLTRNTLLQKMSEMKMDLKDEGKWSVALGLLRDDQNEMALDYWDQMRKDGTEIPVWVADIFTYVLVLRGFLDEAVQLLHQRLNMAGGDRSAVPLVAWSYLLDECSKSTHYGGTKFIWDEMVQPGTLNPADGIALNVLNTAARHGDTALATAVIEFLSARQVKLGLHHYEPLLESYVEAGDLENAFRVLCIMDDIGNQPGKSSTRPIYLWLRRSPELVDQAIKSLKEIQKYPVAALNVVLEAVAKDGDMTKTLAVYRQVCDMGQTGPNDKTFVLLLRECQSAEPAVFLVSEMDRFSVRPSQPILDNLIRCFALDGNLDVALLYLDELSSFPGDAGTPWVSKRTLQAVLHRCYKENHSRMWKLLEEVKRRGIDLSD